jgi:predicted phosphodiesterase
MRLAVVSDIHGNLTALEAVVADLRTVSPDLVVQGGDLPYGGSRPADVVDRVRDLQWPSVLGNTDELLWKPEKHAALVEAVPRLKALFDMLFNVVAPACVAALGAERIAWLQGLPDRWSDHGLAVVHAAPGDPWKGAMPNATDEELLRVYGPLGTPRVVYGHIHVPFVRHLPSLTVANAGSAGMPYDGDPRAAYLLVDDEQITIRRVEYDIDEEVAALARSNHPLADWQAAVLRAGKYIPPPA